MSVLLSWHEKVRVLSSARSLWISPSDCPAFPVPRPSTVPLHCFNFAFRETLHVASTVPS